MQIRQKRKMYNYACAKFLEGKQVMEAEKMWYKSHVCPPEITQTNLLIRLQKKPLEHNLYAVSVSQRKPSTNDAPSPQN